MTKHGPAGRRLKSARLELGWTQRQLEVKTGVPISMIRQYERGRCLPRAERLHLLITTLGIGTQDLFQDTGVRS